MATILVAVSYGLLLMFTDQFLFIAPYLVFYVPPTSLTILALDTLLSILTGIVLVVSLQQVRSSRSKGTPYTGILGIAAALIAGACPCYYLVPLLTIAAGVGGALGAIGILLNAYQLEVKTASGLLLLIVCWGLEKNAGMICRTKQSVTKVN
jgi:multisubunit Na+/H+ antiporter MnhF subunit